MNAGADETLHLASGGGLVFPHTPTENAMLILLEYAGFVYMLSVVSTTVWVQV